MQRVVFPIHLDCYKAYSQNPYSTNYDNMDTLKAFALKEVFLKKPFPHTHNLEKETMLEAETGDSVCTICGLDSNEIKYSEEWSGLSSPE